MALLGSTTLTGCSSIPGFIASGTKLIFENATPPTSWTKDTTHNNKTLRVVNTALLAPGGTQAFTVAFPATKTVAGTVDQAATGMTVNQSVSNTTGQIVSMPAAQTANVSVDGEALLLAQMATHDHGFISRGAPDGTNTTARRPAGTLASATLARTAPAPYPLVTSGSTGQTGSHTHTTSAQTHTHTLGGGTHNHGLSATQHNHTFTGTSQDFAVNYVDLVVAVKD
jgi:hypothetical protein